jgi:hypothetical protein
VVSSLRLSLALSTLAIICCAADPPNTVALDATLSRLSLATPTTDLDKNLSVGDRRLIGINGIVCTPPGVPEGDVPALTGRFGIHCLEGTSDAIEGIKHRQLIEKAAKYAEVYNLELLRRIHQGLVT